jgi:hypothetical protein
MAQQRGDVEAGLFPSNLGATGSHSDNAALKYFTAFKAQQVENSIQENDTSKRPLSFITNSELL